VREIKGGRKKKKQKKKKSEITKNTSTIGGTAKRLGEFRFPGGQKHNSAEIRGEGEVAVVLEEGVAVLLLKKSVVVFGAEGLEWRCGIDLEETNVQQTPTARRRPVVRMSLFILFFFPFFFCFSLILQ
jgi:hypothetical protein